MTTATLSFITAAMTVKQIVEASELSESTVRKHLKAEVAEGNVVKNEDGTYEVPETKVRANHGYARNTSADKKATQRDLDVVAQLVEVGAASKSDIAEALSITERAAYHALWRLRRNGVIDFADKAYSLVEDFDADAWVEAQTAEPEPEPKHEANTEAA